MESYKKTPASAVFSSSRSSIALHQAGGADEVIRPRILIRLEIDGGPSHETVAVNFPILVP
jgi:hypothetical protein